MLNQTVPRKRSWGCRVYIPMTAPNGGAGLAARGRPLSVPAVSNKPTTLVAAFCGVGLRGLEAALCAN